MRTGTLGLAAVTLVAAAAVTVAVWASFWTAPWEAERSENLTEAEVIGLVAQEVGINVVTYGCDAVSMTWEAVSTGSGVWQVGAYCATASIGGFEMPAALRGGELPYSHPEGKSFPLWSFQEGAGQIAPLNRAAVRSGLSQTSPGRTMPLS